MQTDTALSNTSTDACYDSYLFLQQLVHAMGDEWGVMKVIQMLVALIVFSFEIAKMLSISSLFNFIQFLYCITLQILAVSPIILAANTNAVVGEMSNIFKRSKPTHFASIGGPEVWKEYIEGNPISFRILGLSMSYSLILSWLSTSCIALSSSAFSQFFGGEEDEL